MGPRAGMTNLGDTLRWTGTDLMLSVFVISESAEAPQIDQTDSVPRAEHVRSQSMEHDNLEQLLGKNRIYEYDFVFSREPEDLDGFIRRQIENALAIGCRGAWFGFEGSFSFDHLLTADVASLIYAFGDSVETSVAHESELRSTQHWSDQFAALRDRLGIGES